MTTPARIAITGATGQLGGRIARRLADAGIPQHLVVRDPTRAPELSGATVAQATFGDAAAARTAPPITTRQPAVLLDGLARRGERRPREGEPAHSR